MRFLILWCPDWPVVAAAAAESYPPHLPAAVARGTEVISCSAVARAEGIRRGMRKRQAQERCPELKVFEADPQRDARLFEPVAVAVEELAPGIEVIRPGLIAVTAQGPVSYFKSAEQAAERLVDHVAQATGVEAQIGVADGLFAATLAAHRGQIVPATRSAEFLAPLGIQELINHPELVDLLRRLGLRTLGAFAAIPEKDVATRFGGPAVRAHRLARGLEERPLDKRKPPEDLDVTQLFDPPVERVDSAAFAAKALAERLHAGLAEHNLACTRLGIHAETGTEELHRVWRCAEPLTPRGIADRVRWQLDGWRTRSSLHRLRLVPEEVVDAAALQLGLWGYDQGQERAARALVHVQGLLGPDSVFTAVLGGGRGPRDQVRLVPWGDEKTPLHDPDQPWPGRLAGPSPALTGTGPATLRTAADEEIGVTGRNELTGTPHLIAVNGGPPRDVRAWAGPWPVDEKWWDPAGRRAARLQVLTEETAFLLVREGGEWTVEGVYD